MSAPSAPGEHVEHVIIDASQAIPLGDTFADIDDLVVAARWVAFDPLRPSYVALIRGGEWRAWPVGAVDLDERVTVVHTGSTAPYGVILDEITRLSEAGATLRVVTHDPALRAAALRFTPHVLPADPLIEELLWRTTRAARTSFAELVAPELPDEPLDEPLADPDLPECPSCGADMVIRTARRGPSRGSQFYGCETFPDCNATMSLDGHQVTAHNPYRSTFRSSDSGGGWDDDGSWGSSGSDYPDGAGTTGWAGGGW